MYIKSIIKNPSKYRPISIINCSGIILEKIIFKNLHIYIKDHNIHTNNQSGFRSKDSTDQLLNICDTTMKNLVNGKEIRFVFCDITKTFDRVWHTGLIFKQKQYGISEKLLN